MRLAAYEGPARGLPEGLDVLARTGAQVLVYGWRRTARLLGATGRGWQDDGGEWYAEWALPDGARVLAPGEVYTVPAGVPHMVSGNAGQPCELLILQGVGVYNYVPR